MHEVEVKAKLEDAEAFMRALTGLGCELGKEIRQDDTTYVRDTSSLDAYLANADFLRLRIQDDGRTLFTIKHHPGRVTNLNSAPLELELEVSSRDVMERMLSLMGYQEAVRMVKVRRKTRYQMWEICVDEVEGLGSFVELEELADSNERVPEIRTSMQKFLEGLGVKKEDFLMNRYDVLMLQKLGKT